MHESFLGSDAEFSRMTLPPPTQQCVESRSSSMARCLNDTEAQVWGEAGDCDNPPVTLLKLVTSIL